MEKKKEEAVIHELETSRAGKYRNTFQRDLSPEMSPGKANKRSVLNQSMNTLGSTKSVLVHHDWMNTDVYVACKNNVPRYKKPSVGDPRSVQITSYITIMRSNP